MKNEMTAKGNRHLHTLAGRHGRRLVLLACFLALLSFSSPVFSEDVIELHDQTATFTNLAGRVFQDVQLKRATGNGLIYSKTNEESIGMVRYTDLSTNFLNRLKIPAALVQEAARRQAQLALEKEQYDAACRQLALTQTNAVVSPKAVPPPASSEQTVNNAPVAKAKPKPEHRKRR